MPAKTRAAPIVALLPFLLASGAAPTPSPDMFLVPGASFMMGSPESEEERSPDEILHQVKVSSFLLGRYPVSQGLWRAVMGTEPFAFEGSDLLPAERTSWYDAIEFCNRLSLLEGLRPCYAYGLLGTDTAAWPAGWKDSPHDAILCDWKAEGYRLPTESEWELACRSGSSGPTPYGRVLTTEWANFSGLHQYGTDARGGFLGRTTAPGSYPPSPAGFYDIVGNVWQWCWDWYGKYPEGPLDDPRGGAFPAGPEAGSARRSLRGGSWQNYGSCLRSAYRMADDPRSRVDHYGFRLARRAP